jgi:hypothetical protein
VDRRISARGPVRPDSSSLQSNLAGQGLPEKALSGLESLLIQFEIVVFDHGCDDQEELHIRDVSTNASPRPVRERNEAHPLSFRQCVPSIRSKLLGVAAPHRCRMVNRIGWDRERGSGREVVRCDGDAGSRRDEARQTKGRGGMDSKCLVDHILQATI